MQTKNYLLVLLAILSVNSFHGQDIDDWWFTRMGHKRGIKKAKQNELKDTVLSIEEGQVYLFMPKKNDPSKKNLILIHGMGVNGISQWQTQIDDFSKFYNVYIPDLMGYADSKAKNIEYSPEFQVKCIKKAVDLVSDTSFYYVAGFSYGGLVCATFKHEFPNNTGKIAICDGPVKHFSSQITDSIITKRGINHFESLISPKTDHEIDMFFEAIYSGKQPRVTKRLKRKMVTYIFQQNAVMKRGQMDYLVANEQKYRTMAYQFDSEDVLFLWGDEDGAIPKIVGERLHQEYPRSNFHLVKGAKHDSHLMFTEEFNAVLLNHFAGNYN